MSKDKDMPAFPCPEASVARFGQSNPDVFMGLTMRDYFAARAPIASEARISLNRESDRSRNPYNESHKPKIRSDVEIEVSLRYEWADAMIAERNK